MSSILFSQVSIGELRLSNRIVIPPMCQYSASDDGRANDWHLLHYGSMSLSGAGMLIVEATAVTPGGRISNHDLGMWSEDTAMAAADLIKRVRVYSDMPFAVQLGHAGRKGSRDGRTDDTLPAERGGWQVVAPSAIAYDDKYPMPHALGEEEIRDIVHAFASAAARADRAGYDAVEIHAAHGYLLHQFLSPISNHRDDAYGGSFENRIRLACEVFQAVRGAFSPDKPVGIRISGSDWIDGGWNVADSIKLCGELEKLGCAFIHVSGGGLSLAQTLRVGPGYQADMASAVKAAVTIPVIAVGLINSAEQAETIVRSGQADMVAVGRAMMFNPHWPWQAAMELGASVQVPSQYLRSRPRLSPNLFGQGM